MNRPGFTTYLFGNPFSALALAALAACLAYLGFTQTGAWPLLVVALVIASGAGRAYQRIQKYQAWKREWDGLSDRPTSSRLRLSGPVKILAGLALWGVFAYAAMSAHGASGALFSTLFWLGTVVIAGGWFLKRRNAVKPRAKGEAAVTVCPSVPRNSPSLQQAYSGLPGYCVALFNAEA
jgi:hypothetical protein